MRCRAHLLAFTLRGPEKFSRSRIQHPSSTTCVHKGALGSGCSQAKREVLVLCCTCWVVQRFSHLPALEAFQS